MRHWVGVVTEEQFATERLYARDLIAVPAGKEAPDVAEGDAVLLVAPGSPAVVFGHGIVHRLDEAWVHVEYRYRLFDAPAPVPADVETPTPGLHALPPAQFTRLAALVSATAGAGAGRSVWFVSLALPIEAGTAADAVREFWTYVDKLGPQELPAYVWPLGDELAMRAFVLGAVTNLDPEDDDD